MRRRRRVVAEVRQLSANRSVCWTRLIYKYTVPPASWCSLYASTVHSSLHVVGLSLQSPWLVKGCEQGLGIASLPIVHSHPDLDCLAASYKISSSRMGPRPSSA